ncbi:methylmalonyl-CoA mutase small subunit [Raineyella fluvialis]|uniref:Methylmalonyl-CoA mutase small subunit n=1 Tax=Raineyella fluvialis TaxID=2662261 RepID=A0A5Q2F9G8_9ACTN|nr:methylmalonyl-CoA mutase small subunit [Raineyella fluvialis]QGF23542.1 methylmalonyl-CoA mutase small subunit [Raineyella fluvialis]
MTTPTTQSTRDIPPDVGTEEPPGFILAGDFPTPTEADWRAAAGKVLNRKRPPERQLTPDEAVGRLRRATVDDVTIDPLYTREGVTEDLGYPGVMPFVRGTTVRRGQMDAWDVRALHEDPEVAFTRKAVLTDLERGVTSLWLRLDPDAIAPGDLGEVLADVLLDLAKVEVSSRTDQVAAAEALLSLVEASGKDRAALSVNLGLDPIGFAADQGVAADLSGMAPWVARLEGYTQSRPFVVDATLWHNAGAGDVHEVAWALATGLEYVRALVEQGLPLDDAFDAMIFRVTASCDEFATIARLRALRRCWARIGEVLGVAEDRRGARQHAVTSWRELTRDDPYVNMLRGTISTFSAAVGGAEAITTLPFDTARGLPGELSRRVARNTQIVLAEESNIGRVNDPAGGTWYIESLTDEIADAAWSAFQEVEAAGGMVAALADGLPTRILADLNEKRRHLLATRQRPLTGVSEFPNTSEPALDVRPRPEAPAGNGLVRHRDAEVFEALRDRTGDSGQAVFLACLGSRRDFGGREGFASNLFHIAGLATPSCEGGSTDEVVAAWRATGTPVAVLCSSATVYAEQGLEVAAALKEAGARTLLLAGSLKELGDPARASALIDGTIALGVDVVEVLTTTLDTLGVAR